MKIMGISCSPRKEQTTYHALKACLESAREENPKLETELTDLAGLKFEGCQSCWSCRKNNLVCAIQDDFAQLIPRIADPAVVGLVIATPVYMGTMSSRCKAFLDRTLVFRTGGFVLRNRLGGVIAVGGSRNGGQELTIQAVHAALLIHDMVIVGDGMELSHFGGTLWNTGDKELKNDEWGMKTARNLGKRMAQVTALLHRGR